MKRVPAVLCFCLVAASCEEARAAVSNPIGPSPSLIPGESHAYNMTIKARGTAGRVGPIV
jgi:hypothetical protein